MAHVLVGQWRQQETGFHNSTFRIFQSVYQRSITFSAMYYRKTTKTIFPHLCYLSGLCRTTGEWAGPRLTTASTQSTRAGWFFDSSLGYLLSSSQLDCSWYSNILMKTAQQARAICLILKKPKTLTIFFSSGQCNYRKDCPGRQRCVRNK